MKEKQKGNINMKLMLLKLINYLKEKKFDDLEIIEILIYILSNKKTD